GAYGRLATQSRLKIGRANPTIVRDFSPVWGIVIRWFAARTIDEFDSQGLLTRPSTTPLSFGAPDWPRCNRWIDFLEDQEPINSSGRNGSPGKRSGCIAYKPRR